MRVLSAVGLQEPLPEAGVGKVGTVAAQEIYFGIEAQGANGNGIDIGKVAVGIGAKDEVGSGFYQLLVALFAAAQRLFDLFALGDLCFQFAGMAAQLIRQPRCFHGQPGMFGKHGDDALGAFVEGVFLGALQVDGPNNTIVGPQWNDQLGLGGGIVWLVAGSWRHPVSR